VYFPAAGTFGPPFQEYAHNPLYSPTKYNPNGYENCEFFMGPAGEAGHTKGLMHILCNWHGGSGPPGFPKGNAPHFVAYPYAGAQSALNWTYTGSVSQLDGAGEPTPVYEPPLTANRYSAVGIPGDQAHVRYFIARQSRAGMGQNTGGQTRLTIGLYKLTWGAPAAE
jgi:hypothetical protein